MVPLLGSLPTFPLPLSIPDAFFRKYVVGGVRVVKVNVRSGWIVTEQGVGRSTWRCAVRALLGLAEFLGSSLGASELRIERVIVVST